MYPDLHTKQGLKCRRIDPIAAVSTRNVDPTPFGRYFMWDQDVGASFFTTLRAETFFDGAEEYDINGSITNFPRWRLMCFLSLSESDRCLTGLTVYCTSGGMTAIEAHFQDLMPPYREDKRVVGDCRGRPIHFPLRRDECIIAVWIRRYDPTLKVFATPTLVVSGYRLE